MLTELQGQIERITYSNEQNGFTIAKVKVAGRRELVTVSGNFLAPTPGEVLKMTGEWINHPRYGQQFKVVQFESQVPASVHGIQKYLGSGLIKGIGPVMAPKKSDLLTLIGPLRTQYLAAHPSLPPQTGISGTGYYWRGFKENPKWDKFHLLSYFENR